MNLNLTKKQSIYKYIFSLKPPERDGLVLTLHHTDKICRKIRLTSACFDYKGILLAVADIEAKLFLVDLNSQKFWNLPKSLNHLTVMSFCPERLDEIIIGLPDGQLYVINIQNGLTIGKLIGHCDPVTHISFSENFLCLTSSNCEAIVWDLKTNVKLQVLKLAPNCSLKYASFIPGINDILTCYTDDIVQIWQFGTYEVKCEIPPCVWYNREVKNFTFTQDGKMMLICLRSPHLALFLLSNYKLLKYITLPENLQTLKQANFIPQINDGGSNRLVSILTGRGSLLFYDVDQNLIISELIPEFEIQKYTFSSKGSYMGCVLCNGDVTVYDSGPYIIVPLKIKAIRVGRGVKMRRGLDKVGVVKGQIRQILEIDKLRMILKECGEYPEKYRAVIWEHLLQLPNNINQYNAMINHRMVASFEGLYRNYPLQDKRTLKNLRQLLDNLVTWCPFFAHVDYLPLFVFPFVKVFINNPVICFEATATIIVNWCQFWFEYFPLPPVNILAIIENILMEQDSYLLDFFQKKKITSKVFAWPLLKTIFSEILTASQWTIFWDHVLTNAPSFLLCAVVAYNLIQRKCLLALKTRKKIDCFFSTHHPIDVKNLLAKTYRILSDTDIHIHPRQYLNGFKRITPGEYPDFCDYPKAIIQTQEKRTEHLTKEMGELNFDEVDLFKKRLQNLEKLEDEDQRFEENKRLLEMEEAIRKQLQEEELRVEKHRERIAQMREKVNEQDDMLESLRRKMAVREKQENRGIRLRRTLDDVNWQKRDKDNKVSKLEEKLLYHYSELLKSRCKVEKLLEDGGGIEEIIQMHQDELAGEMDIINSSRSINYLKNLNLATGLEAIDLLIVKIEEELKNQQDGPCITGNEERVLELKKEAREVATEIGHLIRLLAEIREEEIGE